MVQCFNILFYDSDFADVRCDFFGPLYTGTADDTTEYIYSQMTNEEAEVNDSSNQDTIMNTLIYLSCIYSDITA